MCFSLSQYIHAVVLQELYHSWSRNDGFYTKHKNILHKIILKYFSKKWKNHSMVVPRGKFGTFWCFPDGPQKERAKYSRWSCPCLASNKSCPLEKGRQYLCSFWDLRAHWKETLYHSYRVPDLRQLLPIPSFCVLTNNPTLIYWNRHRKSETCLISLIWATKSLQRTDNLFKKSPVLILDNRQFFPPI